MSQKKINQSLVNQDLINQERPTPPGDFECCENGCTPCVWDIYFEQLNLWKAAQKALQDSKQTLSGKE